MILHPIIRATRIVTACSIIDSQYQLEITALTEIISFSVPILNERLTGLPFVSYIIPLMCAPKETCFFVYEYNKEKYHIIELFSLILLLFFIYYK
tara:strand:+ start:45 stop:329 length:285 start_codon:yes stop_codon:yes gene_type:complete